MRDNLALELVEAGEYRSAEECLLARSNYSSFDLLARAILELEVGDIRQAEAQSRILLRGQLSPMLRVHCESVLGRAQGRGGYAKEGLRVLARAVESSKDLDGVLYAQQLAHYCAALLGWIGIEPALVELPKLRRAALSSGNNKALIEFHILSSRIATMRGDRTRAIHEVNVAEQLLVATPHPSQLWKVKQLQSNFAIKSANLESASAHAEACLALASKCGGRLAMGTSLGNLAHIAVLRGAFSEARQLLNKALSALDSTSKIRIAAFSTGLELALASNDAVLAAEMLQSRAAVLGSDSDESVYYEIWFALSHARWLCSREEFDEASRIAVSAMPAATLLADSDLLHRLKLTTAECLASVGNRQQAHSLLAEVVAEDAEINAEVLVEIYRVAALCIADTEQATLLLAGAARIIESAGLVGLKGDVQRVVAKCGLHNNCVGVSALELLNAIATLLQLNHQPDVIRGELAFISGMLRREGKSSSHRNVPVTLEDFCLKHIANAAHVLALTPRTTANPPLWPQESPEEQLGMVASSHAMSELLDVTRRLAPSNITVLITGETGTGKELVARALHDASPRKEKPFIPYNCSAVAADMLDAQLFGYRRGAFTGAQEGFQGVIRAAAGGTLFLDEIGEIAPDVQPKLLRFLESGEIHPLGETKPINVDVRVVAATNANLQHLVDAGTFREDLYYRLNVVHLDVPPLRERREEIPPLVQHYLERCSREARKHGIRLAEETMEYLMLFRWPGNVRQLANEVRRLVALAESGAVLMPEHLSTTIATSRRTIPASERDLAQTELVVRIDQPMSAATEHVERAMIQHALRTSASVEEAAQLLGLSRKGLYLKRQRLGLTDGARGGPTRDATTQE